MCFVASFNICYILLNLYMFSLGLQRILLIRKSRFSSVNPGLPERWIERSEPALLNIVPNSFTISVVRPVQVKSKWIRFLLCFIAPPKTSATFNYSFSGYWDAAILFQDKLMYWSLRFLLIISIKPFIVFGMSEFQLMSRLVNLFWLFTIYSR